MPVFQYTARTLKGDLVNDKIDLPSRDDVIAHLRKNRMVVVQVRAAPREFKLSFKFGGGVKTRDIVVLTRQFATMINAGLPLVQALDILAQQTENLVLGLLRQNVERLDERQAGVDHRGELPREHHDVARLDAAAELEAELELARGSPDLHHHHAVFPQMGDDVIATRQVDLVVDEIAFQGACGVLEDRHSSLPPGA